VTQYLLDLQPGLAVVLADTTGAAINRYVHGPMGIYAQKDSTNNWEWMVQDGLGSVRGVADHTNTLIESRQYAPYGSPFAGTGTNQTIYGFTGEQTDPNALLFLRARYYAPELGTFVSKDTLETLNRYTYVHGDPINNIDPTGMIFWNSAGIMGTGANSETNSAHGVIQYWSESANGVWSTQLEFPGAIYQNRGIRPIDIVVFSDPNMNLLSTSPIDFRSQVTTAEVFEIESIFTRSGSSRCPYAINYDGMLKGYVEELLVYSRDF
jgi:RHS repeat-associated protein